MTNDEIAALRVRIEFVRDNALAARDELAQIALRLLAHLEHATERQDRADMLAAALDYKARAGTLDELLTQALARYRGGG